MRTACRHLTGLVAALAALASVHSLAMAQTLPQDAVEEALQIETQIAAMSGRPPARFARPLGLPPLPPIGRLVGPLSRVAPLTALEPADSVRTIAAVPVRISYQPALVLALESVPLDSLFATPAPAVQVAAAPRVAPTIVLSPPPVERAAVPPSAVLATPVDIEVTPGTPPPPLFFHRSQMLSIQ
jgi:hypothetical protein